MGRIVAVPLSEPGHVTPMLGLADALRRRGHEIVFATHFDMQSFVEARGFPVVPLETDVWPLGAKERVRAAPLALRERHHGHVRRRRHLDHCIDDGFPGLSALAPELVLCDLFLWQYALGAYRLKLPVCMVNTMVSLRLEAGVPPLTTASSPSTARLQLEALRHTHTCLATDSRLSQLVHHLVARSGYDPAAVSFDASLAPVFTRFPELVLTPKAFDLPRPDGAGVHHFVVPTDRRRPSAVPETLASFVDPDRPLIFASLGTQAYRYSDAVPLFEAFFEALRRRPQWHAVVALGRELLDRHVWAAVPPNVLLLAEAPQLWVLERAAAFVTHGGINGVMEAIEYETPMLMVPQGFDQPGNATRVAYHGMGLLLPREALNREAIDRRLALLLEERRFLDAVRRVRAAVAAEREHNGEGLALLEAAMRPAASGPGAKPAPGAPILGPERGWLFFDGDDPPCPEGLEMDPPLRDEHPGPLRLGHSGHAYPSLGEALQRARGTQLARLEIPGGGARDHGNLVGSPLRVLWSLDASDVLDEYAWWCAERATQRDRAIDPDLAEVFAAARGGDPAYSPSSARLRDLAQERWEGGYVAYVAALVQPPHLAAMEARHEMIATLALEAAGARLGTEQGAALFESALQGLRRSTSEELERRVVAAATARLGPTVLDEQFAPAPTPASRGDLCRGIDP